MPPRPPTTLADLTIFYGPTSGGVRTYLTRKRDFVAARGYRHLLVVPGGGRAAQDDPFGRTLTIPGIRVPFAPGYRLVLSRRAAEAALVRERPALVEVGDPYVLAWAAFGARARVGCPVVLFVHSDFVETYVRPGLGGAAARAAWAYARAVYGRADLVLVPSRAVASTFEAHGVRGAEVMPLGVDTQRFRPDRRRDEVRRALGGDRRPVCLYAGRLAPEKGIETLLEALPRLAAGGAVVWVAGVGPLDRRVEAAARRHPVWPLGHVDPERLADLYASADVVLVPGAHETFGLTALEALASGTPVVAAAAGGPAEILGPEVGALVAPGDPAALADVALRVARGGREARVAACRRRAEAHAWEAALGRLVARYERLLAARRSAAGEGAAGGPGRSPRAGDPPPADATA